MTLLQDHVATGITTLCRCWAVVRTDGAQFAFTDHDQDLSFDGLQFRANTGLSAAMLEQSTGLSVDNTEAIGALSDASLNDADILAGRFDGAEVRAWLVNWRDVSQRDLRFRGQIGEIVRQGGAFRAELRGLTEALNKPVGRVYQKPCSAVLGDTSCRFDLSQTGYVAELAIELVRDRQVLIWSGMAGFEPGWFERGRLDVGTGQGSGLFGLIKHDRTGPDGAREITLWHPIRAELKPGDHVRLTAGCDKRMETCRFKFANLLNFQGFPDVPGDDWSVSDPAKTGALDGGSRR